MLLPAPKLVLLLPPAAAPPGDSSAAEEKPEGWWKEELTTVTDGKLTVATSPDFAPYEFYAIDENGDPQLAGFDMDLAQYIADYMGLELEIIPMDFDGTIMELQNKNVDLGMAGYSPDPDRASVMDFSDIYITGGQSFVCVQDNKDQFTSLEDATTLTTRSALRWAPSRLAWPRSTPPTRTSWS